MSLISSIILSFFGQITVLEIAMLHLGGRLGRFEYCPFTLKRKYLLKEH